MPLDCDKIPCPEGHSELAFLPPVRCGVNELVIYPHIDTFLKSLLISKYPVGLTVLREKSYKIQQIKTQT